MATPVTLHQATTSEALITVLFSVGAALAASSTNYWTLTVRVKRPGQELGEDVVEYSLKDIAIGAGDAVQVYNSERGFALNPGDKVVVYKAATGSPVTPTDATMPVLIQRNVR